MVKLKFSRFLLLAPIFILFAGGVLSASVNKVTPSAACVTLNFTGQIDFAARTAFYNNQEISVPSSVALLKDNSHVLGVASPGERWIEVDLSEQKLRAWDKNSLFLETLVSTGLPGTPTPTGEFRVWVKLRATKMEGGQGRYYYNLPNVPFVMYFENDSVPGWRGFGIHGTYWHDDFGTPHSHGCVNVPTTVAQELYYWATPELPAGRQSVFADSSNAGIRVVIHD